MVHVHHVGNLTDTGLITQLTNHQGQRELANLLDQPLEVEIHLVVEADSFEEGEETVATQVKMTEQFADVLDLLTTDRTGQRWVYYRTLNLLINILCLKTRNVVVEGPLGDDVDEARVLEVVEGRQEDSGALGAGVDMSYPRMSLLVEL